MRKEEPVVETEKTDVFRIVGAFVIGGVLGAAAGLLLAPRSGEETRNELRGAAGKTLEEARYFYSEARAKADAVLEDARRKADELTREAERQLQDGRQKVGTIVGGSGKRLEKGPADSISIESPEEIMGGMA